MPSWSRAVAEEGGVWVVLLHHHHQGGLSTAGCARPVRRASRGCRKYLPAPPGRHQTPQPGSFWLRPRPLSSPPVSRALIHLHRWRAEVRVPLGRSTRIVQRGVLTGTENHHSMVIFEVYANWHSSWLRPRPPSSPQVTEAICRLHRWRVQVWMPSHQSRRIVAPSGSVLDHF